MMHHNRGKLDFYRWSEEFGTQKEKLRLMVALRLRSVLSIFYNELLRTSPVGILSFLK